MAVFWNLRGLCTLGSQGSVATQMGVTEGSRRGCVWKGVIVLNIYPQGLGLSPRWRFQHLALEAGPPILESPHPWTSSLEGKSPLPKTCLRPFSLLFFPDGTRLYPCRLRLYFGKITRAEHADVGGDV